MQWEGAPVDQWWFDGVSAKIVWYVKQLGGSNEYVDVGGLCSPLRLVFAFEGEEKALASGRLLYAARKTGSHTGRM